jgi:hypothetical protein
MEKKYPRIKSRARSLKSCKCLDNKVCDPAGNSRERWKFIGTAMISFAKLRRYIHLRQIKIGV